MNQSKRWACAQRIDDGVVLMSENVRELEHVEAIKANHI